MSKIEMMEQEIASRPEGSRDEDILWLYFELRWSTDSVGQALQISSATVSKVIRRHQAERVLH